MNLNHLHLHVRSVERAKTFYERFFGMREHVWHGDVVFLRDDSGMDLALAPAAQAEALPRWFHFGFRLGGPQDVDRLYHTMLQAGVAMAEPLAEDGEVVAFRCKDPDGYRVEVYWEPQPA